MRAFSSAKNRPLAQVDRSRHNPGMSLVVRELARSRKITVGKGTATGEIKYIAYREDDIATVRTEVAATVPATFEGMDLVGTPLVDLGGGVWDVTANYELSNAVIDSTDDIGEPGSPLPEQTQGEPGGPNNEPGGGVDPNENNMPGDDEPLGAEWSFDTTGATERILRSIETIEKLPVDAPSYDRAINVSKEGVEGVDIPKPTLRLTCKKTHPFMTMNYIRMLAFATRGKGGPNAGAGVVNDRKWGTWEAYEVLFLGAQSTQDSNGRWPTTYIFEPSPNLENVQVDEAGDMIFDFKGGHDYIWVQQAELVPGNALSRKVIAAYLERIYSTFNFNKFWI